jgi:hypothetical protein
LLLYFLLVKKLSFLCKCSFRSLQLPLSLEGRVRQNSVFRLLAQSQLIEILLVLLTLLDAAQMLESCQFRTGNVMPDVPVLFQQGSSDLSLLFFLMP